MRPAPDGERRIRFRGETPGTEDFQRLETRRGGRPGVIWVLAAALFFLFWASLFLAVPYRQFRLDPAWYFEHIRGRFSHFYLFLQGRLPAFGVTVWRYLAVMLAGAALAACGAAFQGSFRNMLAGPSTMGAMSGGSLGALAFLLLFYDTAGAPLAAATADLAAWENRSLWEVYSQQLCILLGAFLAVGAVLLVATAAGKGKLSGGAMVLSGTVLSSLTGNITMAVQYYLTLKDPYDTRIEALRDLMMGSFDNITRFRDVVLLGVPILICLALILAAGGRLNLLAFGEEEAVSMGLNARLYRNLMVVLATVLTGVVVAFCGRIGFLGFMCPLVGRKLVGPDMRRLLPCSMLVGAILLMLVYDAAYVSSLTGYINLFTSAIGAAVMAAAILGRKGGGARAHADETASPAGLGG